MNCDLFLSAVDASRLTTTLERLARHDVSKWALAGGIAIELLVLRCGGEAWRRGLHDVDFVVGAFDEIPVGLGGELLLRHVHPYDPPGKNMLQGVDASAGVRMDVFRAYGGELDRLSSIELCGVPLKMVSLEDMVARHARLCWDLVGGVRVAPKFARDFLRLVEFVVPAKMEAIWQEHRKPGSAESFAVAVEALRRTIAVRTDLLVAPVYSTDVDAVCSRCHETEAFPLADAREVMAILGYC
jgi:hypothetical protein